MKRKCRNTAADISSNPNTRIYALGDGRNGFSIYIDISGKQEYIMSHRHNVFLYDLMKNGVSFSELRRWEPRVGRSDLSRKYIKNKVSSVSHIIKVIDEYIREEIAYGEEPVYERATA